MDHVKAIINLLKRIFFGKIEDGTTFEALMIEHIKNTVWKPYVKPKPGEKPEPIVIYELNRFWEDDVFSPYDLLKDFDVRKFIRGKMLEVIESFKHKKDLFKTQEAFLWGLEEIQKLPDDELFKYFVENFFESDKELYKFVVEHQSKKSKHCPHWWFYIKNSSYEETNKPYCLGDVMNVEFIGK